MDNQQNLGKYLEFRPDIFEELSIKSIPTHFSLSMENQQNLTNHCPIAAVHWPTTNHQPLTTIPHPPHALPQLR